MPWLPGALTLPLKSNVSVAKLVGRFVLISWIDQSLEAKQLLVNWILKPFGIVTTQLLLVLIASLCACFNANSTRIKAFSTLFLFSNAKKLGVASVAKKPIITTMIKLSANVKPRSCL